MRIADGSAAAELEAAEMLQGTFLLFPPIFADETHRQVTHRSCIWSAPRQFVIRHSQYSRSQLFFDKTNLMDDHQVALSKSARCIRFVFLARARHPSSLIAVI